MRAPKERHLWVWYSPYGMGGVETYLLNMIRETVSDNAAVWVAATKSGDGPLREQFVRSGAELLDWTDFNDAYMTNRPEGPVRQRLMTDLARIKPTLLALNDCNDFSIGAAPALRRIRRYCTVLDTFHIDSPINQYLDFRRTFIDSLDGIAATNQNVIDTFRRRYPRESSLEVRYIPNGVDVPDRERSPATRTLKLLYVGRLVQDQKRILELPELLGEIAARGKDFTMTIVGDGPCMESLAGSLARRNLTDRVRLTGYLSPQEVVDLYFHHDVLVNLSTFEGFSMSVLEAFAAGCVPVCTDVDSLDRDVFQNGVNCRLCPVNSLELMVDIWMDLTPELIQQLSARARATGLSLTAQNTYQKYREFLEVLRQRRPLEDWPDQAESFVNLEWDLTENNPGLARPHPLRGLGRSAWARVRETLNGRR